MRPKIKYIKGYAYYEVDSLFTKISPKPSHGTVKYKYERADYGRKQISMRDRVKLARAMIRKYDLVETRPRRMWSHPEAFEADEREELTRSSYFDNDKNLYLYRGMGMHEFNFMAKHNIPLLTAGHQGFAP